jgi:hypothetical protein
MANAAYDCGGLGCGFQPCICDPPARSELLGLTRAERLIVAKASAHQELTRNGLLAAVSRMLADLIELDGLTARTEDARADARILVAVGADHDAVRRWIDALR